MSGEGISERARQLLKLLVERYIRDGQPVGSRALVEAGGLSMSPATARNIMADLEERGFLRAPHTSAGRVPTALGYRFFVDTLITVRPLDQQSVASLRAQLDPDTSPRGLAESASQLLSRITAQACLVTVPRENLLMLRRLEFVPLSDNRVLVVLVVNERQVQNRVIYTDRPYSAVELQQAANLINRRFAGQGLEAARRDILQAMRVDRDRIDHYLQASLDLASKALEPRAGEGEPDYVVAGESHLLGATPPDEIDKLRGLLDAFQQKRDILDLVDRCLRADGVQIFIGEEAGYEVFGDFSVVTAPYESGGQPLGVLGVIGPTRMAYERVIPIVDVTARMLSAALRGL